MIWQKIRLDALLITFLMTYLIADFYPHPKLGKSLTERAFLTVKQSLVKHKSPNSKRNPTPRISRRPVSTSDNF